MTDDDLDVRLARAARTHPHVTTETLDALARDARAQGWRSRRTRLIGGASVGLVALLAGLFAAPAAADGIREFLALTGDVCDYGTECQEGDPVIDLSASDLSQLVHADYPEYLELPPGVSRIDMERAVVERMARLNALTYESAVGQQYENLAYCGWVREWLDADDAGDPARVASAAGVMRRAITWPATAGSVVDEAWFTLHNDFANAAEDGDRAGVRAASVVNACGEVEDKEIRAWMASWAESQ